MPPYGTLEGYKRKRRGTWKPAKRRKGAYVYKSTRAQYAPAPVRRAARRMLNTRTAGFLGIEKKFYDTALANAALVAPTDAAGGEVDPSATSMISTPVQATGPQDRDGKKILIKSAVIKGHVQFPAAINLTALVGQVSVFVALVLDTQSNVTQMNSEDCFKNLAGLALTAPTPMRNLLFGERFKVLKSELIKLPIPQATFDGTNIEQSGARQDFDWYVKTGNLKVNFNAGTTASIANVIDNSLHMIAYCSSTTLAPTISYNARIRFVG